MEGYCCKCKVKQEMGQVKYLKTKNGKPRAAGVCTVCGTNMSILGPMSWLEKFKEFFDGD